MRLFFYSNDLGPAKNLAMIASEAVQQGHRVFFVGNDMLAPDIIDPDMLSFYEGLLPDAVVTGLSSFKNNEEIALGLAATKINIPWTIIADTHRSWARPAAKKRVTDAIVLVASPMEIEDAKNFGYGRVEHFGGPPMWQDLWGIPSGERIHPAFTVYVSGIKSREITDEFLEAVVEGVRRVMKNDWAFIFRPHPNEEKITFPSDADLTMIEMLKARREKILEGINVFKSDLTSSALAVSADISFFTSGATDTITCAMHRRIACYYESPSVRSRMKSETGIEEWYPAEVGAVLKVTNAKDVAETVGIAECGDTMFITGLNRRQNAAYPIPKPGLRVERQILSFLKDLIEKK